MTNLLIGDDNTIQFPRTSAPTYDSFVASLSPLLDMRFNESSGNLTNYGSHGGTATANGTPVYSVAGSPTNSAIRLNSIGDFFTIPNDVALDLPTFTWIWTVRAHANAVATSSQGRVFDWGNGHVLLMNPTADPQYNAQAPRTVGSLTVQSGSNAISTNFTPPIWLTIVVKWDGTTFTLRVFNATLNITVTDTTGSGEVTAHGSSGLYIGNRSAGGRQADMDYGGMVFCSGAIDATAEDTLRTILYGV